MNDKQCSIRLPAELHRQAKLRAYEEAKTLQDWLIDLIRAQLAKKGNFTK
jgi:predicted HicB family RNase H-like nuclease